MFSKAVIAGLVSLAAAYVTPEGDSPIGNPIFQPGLNSIVTAGVEFTVTWNNTSPGPITLVLLKGPSTNAVPQYAIVEHYPNNGSYVWTPKTDLEPTDNAQGYGIQLIDEKTHEYQYTTQFGIANPDYKKGGEKPSSSSSSESPKGYESKTAPVYSTKPATYSTGYLPKPTSGAIYHANNVTMVAPTGYKPTTPATLSTSASAAKPTGPSATFQPPQQTGAASTVAFSFVGLVAAAGAAVLAI